MKLVRDDGVLVFASNRGNRSVTVTRSTDGTGYILAWRSRGRLRQLDQWGTGEIVSGPELCARATADEIDVIEGRSESASTIRTHYGEILEKKEVAP